MSNYCNNVTCRKWGNPLAKGILVENSSETVETGRLFTCYDCVSSMECG